MLYVHEEHKGGRCENDEFDFVLARALRRRNGVPRQENGPSTDAEHNFHSDDGREFVRVNMSVAIGQTEVDTLAETVRKAQRLDVPRKKN